VRVLLAGSAVVIGMLAAAPVAAVGGRPAQGAVGVDAVRVDQVSIDVPGQAPLDAFLVRPDGSGQGRRHAYAGVVDLHWFEPGHASADASEFLPEAVELANRGVVSVLPQQRFPWEADPVGDERDVAAVNRGIDDARAAFDYLARQRSVDPDRLAIVGHDYGAMYGAVVAQTDPRVSATVLMALDATWANWFDLFWLHLEGDDEAAYFALFTGLDPIHNVTRLGPAQLFQWAETDDFIPADVRDQFAAATPASPATTYPGIDHSLDLTAAEADRIQFLSTQLDLVT
jgi:dienelactone hydrolase